MKGKNAGRIFKKMARHGFLGWSWRESTPRLHKKTICFLHAYYCLQFSMYGKIWSTNNTD